MGTFNLLFFLLLTLIIWMSPLLQESPNTMFYMGLMIIGGVWWLKYFFLIIFFFYTFYLREFFGFKIFLFGDRSILQTCFGSIEWQCLSYIAHNANFLCSEHYNVIDPKVSMHCWPNIFIRFSWLFYKLNCDYPSNNSPPSRQYYVPNYFIIRNPLTMGYMGLMIIGGGL